MLSFYVEKMTTHFLDNLPKKLKFYLNLSFIILMAWHSMSHAEDSTRVTPASIQTPGADLANFPNSAFTLPQGRAYLELSPINYSSRSQNATPAQYSAGYLLRYGLTDDVELRLHSSGYTLVDDADKTEGMSPQNLAIKWHIANEQQNNYLPALGIEVSIKTNWATRPFRGGWQPTLSLNFDQTLPYDITFEYNVGFTTQQTDAGKTQYQLALSWAFQKEIFQDIAAFVNGYTNTGNSLTTTAVGAGLQWTPTQQLALFSNVSAGLTTSTPKVSALVGFAIAF